MQNRARFSCNCCRVPSVSCCLGGFDKLAVCHPCQTTPVQHQYYSIIAHRLKSLTCGCCRRPICCAETSVCDVRSGRQNVCWTLRNVLIL